MLSRFLRASLLISAALCSLTAHAAPSNDALASGFVAPPGSARPHTWWHWMNGNVTRAGITADLEAMKRVGVGGAQIFNVSEGIPDGPVRFMSPEFKGMIHFAASEAQRLGLELCLHNCAGWSSSGGPWNTPANAMQFVTSSEQKVSGPQHFEAALAQPNTQLGYYQDIAILAFPTPAQGFAIPNLNTKAAFERGDNIEPAQGPEAPPEAVVKRASVVNLTSRFQGGKLSWDVPEGNWTILRIGHTPTGQTNHPAPPEATGPEVDKLSKSALDAHWNGMMQPLLDEIGPLAGKSVNNSLIDSYEVGNQNWTPLFRQEFQQRRGYDILPYLPIFMGRVVDSVAVSERVLWDIRRTVADLMDENYFGHFAQLCHQHGLKMSTEPYGNGPFEDMTAGSAADIPMGEFWAGDSGSGSVKLASSIGHVYGKPIVGAESFTAAPENGKWTNDPYSMKALGDAMFCSGLNRMIFHRYAMQPWLNRFPGMTMGQWGIHFERTNTLWEPQAAWLRYIARCQYLLQQGRFVADALYASGENAPVSLRYGDPALPAGYDYDGISTDAIMRLLSVRDGRIVTSGGMSYRVLVLPPGQTMTPAMERKLRDLIQAGATVVGPRPTRSPSLEGFPACDAQVQVLADQIWGNCDGKTITSHALGRGRVFWGQSMAQVLASLNAPPDFSSQGKGARLSYTHRTAGGSDIYFVSNQRNSAQEAECAFRVSGRTPELWHADTRIMEPAPLYHEANGHTFVSLRFEPVGSVFVLFRRPAPRAHLVSAEFAGPRTSAAPLPELKIQSATYEATDGFASADVTAKVAAQIENNSLSMVIGNDVFGDPASMHIKHLRVEYTLGGKAGTAIVPENGTLELGSSGSSAFPPIEWSADSRGRAQVIAWQPGSLQLRDSSGQMRRVSLPSALPAQTLEGPWQLRFPPDWGAPASVRLDKLASWTQNTNSGVRYFSGTATYAKDFTLNRSQIGASQVLALDLGAVKNLARVRLNGTDLGVLWKPPFRVDITRAAKVGANHLEIEVTNGWPNRLIGDEQLPEDREWDGIRLKKWPDWVLQGKPSPTGRYTFTTWHHWTKDSPLQESGLLGPVVLHVGQKVAVR